MRKDRPVGQRLLAWQWQLVESYADAVDSLAEKGVRLHWPDEEFERWVGGYSRPNELIEEYPAFVRMSPFWSGTGAMKWSPFPRAKLPEPWRSEYVTVCIAYQPQPPPWAVKGLQDDGTEFGSIARELKRVYSRLGCVEKVLESSSPFLRAVRKK